jgi:hypothetical protein
MAVAFTAALIAVIIDPGVSPRGESYPLFVVGLAVAFGVPAVVSAVVVVAVVELVGRRLRRGPGLEPQTPA